MSGRYYVSLESAKEELLGRSTLISKVEEWWEKKGFTPPSNAALFDLPTAVFARQLATARYEDLVFYLIAKKAGLSPLWLEYSGDLMTDCSPLKRSYLRLYLCSGRGRNGGFRPLVTRRLADMQASNKKRLDEIETREGPLPEVHRQLQDKLIPGARRGDVTEWYRRIPGTPKTLRYEAFLSLFVAHSVLFEDYHGGESGQALYGFTQLVVEPAWQRLADIFGEKPLIVKMSWRPEFAWYPADESWPKHGIVPENLLRYR